MSYAQRFLKQYEYLSNLSEDLLAIMCLPLMMLLVSWGKLCFGLNLFLKRTSIYLWNAGRFFLTLPLMMVKGIAALTVLPIIAALFALNKKESNTTYDFERGLLIPIFSNFILDIEWISSLIFSRHWLDCIKMPFIFCNRKKFLSEFFLIGISVIDMFQIRRFFEPVQPVFTFLSELLFNPLKQLSNAGLFILGVIASVAWVEGQYKTFSQLAARGINDNEPSEPNKDDQLPLEQQPQLTPQFQKKADVVKESPVFWRKPHPPKATIQHLL